MPDIEDYFSHWSAQDHRPTRTPEEGFSQTSIPARITLGRFVALGQHLRHAPETRLQDLYYFDQKIQKNKTFDFKRVAGLLYNSWNTEYLLRLSEHQRDDYLRIALHWSFPQAYYCAYLNMHAFFLAKGILCKTHEAVIRQFASLVAHKAYPEVISFHLTGELDAPGFVHLPHYNPHLKHVELSPIRSLESVQTSIGNFLRTTRRERAKQLKEERQSRKNTALKTKDGHIRTQFQSEHWKIITDRMGITTVFDLLYRLRIKANYQEVDTFIQDQIECRPFYGALRELVAYLNFVHESYTAKTIGIQRFRELVADFPGRREQQFVEHRLRKQIEPLFER
ncbi:MAG: hypothetical protein ACFCUI_11570 [Bernardetiaceae bacterium]